METKSQSKTNGVTVAVEPAPEEPKAQPSPEKAGGTSLTALAKKIAEKAEELENYMTENGLPMPSFDSGPAADLTKLPDDIQKSRQEIVSLAADLRDLVKGPRECLRWMAWDVSRFPSLTYS